MEWSSISKKLTPSPDGGGTISYRGVTFKCQCYGSGDKSSSTFNRACGPFTTFSDLTSHAGHRVSIQRAPQHSVSSAKECPVYSFGALSTSITLISVNVPSSITRLKRLPRRGFYCHLAWYIVQLRPLLSFRVLRCCRQIIIRQGS